MPDEPKRDDDRRRTLTALIALADGHNPADCWDDRRAEELLRSQSSAAEARELGMSEAMIAHVFSHSPEPGPQCEEEAASTRDGADRRPKS